MRAQDRPVHVSSAAEVVDVADTSPAGVICLEWQLGCTLTRFIAGRRITSVSPSMFDLQDAVFRAGDTLVMHSIHV